MKVDRDKLIVVTGASGMIGSGVVRLLNERGYSNLLLVDAIHESQKWKNLCLKKFVDFITPDEFLDFFAKRHSDVEAVIHLGACSSTMELDGDYLMRNNYRYSVQLAEIALEHNIRFIYASSAATYGDGSRGFSDDHDGLDALVPLNLYGFSKHLFDLWLKQEGALDRVVGLKYFNIFGPNENHKGRMASLIFHAYPKVKREGKLQLFRSNDPDHFGDGEQCRDFFYVKDAARLTCDFLENEGMGIFNIGMGVATTWNEVAEALFDALGQKKQIEYIDMPENLAKQYQNYTCADMSKYLNWSEGKPSASFTVKEAIRDYVQNHLEPDLRW